MSYQCVVANPFAHGYQAQQVMDEARQCCDGLITKNGGGQCEWLVHMEFHDPRKNSNKFYEAGEDMGGFYVRWGRIGTNGTKKEHPSFMSIVRKVEEKAGKGYDHKTLVGDGFSVERKTYFAYLSVADAQGQLAVAPQSGSQSHDSLAFYRSKRINTVDLSGISAMFQIIKTVQWDAALDQWRGFNAEGEVIMTVPEHVMVKWEVRHG